MVAFTAVLARGSIDLGPHQTLIYDKILLNVGGGYKIRSGHFEAPVSGIYSVSVTLLAQWTNRVELDLIKNGVVQVRLVTQNGDRSEMSSQTIVLALGRNDSVWVRRGQETKNLNRGGKIYGLQPYNSFSVSLLARGKY